MTRPSDFNNGEDRVAGPTGTTRLLKEGPGRTLARLFTAGLRIGAALLVLVQSAPTGGCTRVGQSTPGQAQQAAGANSRPDLVLVTVDTLRADHLSIYGYERPTSPQIDEFFAEGTVFERAYSTEAMTSPSVVSFLTGMLPQQHGVRVLYQRIPQEIDTIADTLRAAGYQTAAIVSNMVLTGEAIGLDTRFDHYDDFVDESELYRDVYERRASRTTDAALLWLDRERRPDRPTFLWVHYIDPHGRYHPPRDRPVDFRHDSPVPVSQERIPEAVREPGNLDGADYVDRYDEEIAYADREIGRLLRGLPELGLPEAFVLFTSDHGESMMEHELWFRHGHDVYEEVVRVPLMIRGPGIASRTVGAPVSIADVAPTIGQLAGVDATDTYGRSLLDVDPERPVFAEAGGAGPQVRAMWLTDGKWRVTVRWSDDLLARATRSWFRTFLFTRGVAVERRYYDLVHDPGERRPHAWTQDSRAEPLLRLIADDPTPGGKPLELGDRAGRQIQEPKLRPDLDEETLDRLRALGYVQ